MIHTGDCVAVMQTMDADSIDAIVTDPPYGLEFMGKAWDRLGDVGQASHSGFEKTDFKGFTLASYNASANVKCRKCSKWKWDHEGRKCECEAPDFANVKLDQSRRMQAWHEAWAREAFRVAKPGAHLLAFGGTRTYHRLASAIEDAGWEIRDCLVWAYASGFPKSLNFPDGFGTALKPAWEPIVMARRPLIGTVAANRAAHGTGALNIDATRIGTEQTVTTNGAGFAGSFAGGHNDNGGAVQLGRWPANLILTDPIFDGDTPGVVGGGSASNPADVSRWTADGQHQTGTTFGRGGFALSYGDSGTYSRFFLIPKSSRSDREPLVRGAGNGVWSDGREKPADYPSQRGKTVRQNAHPTVKPIDLMRHLVRLVTPPGGTVLDCFLGSGTTAIAAEMEGFAWIGIEKEAEYVAIAEARLNGTQRGLGLDVAAPTRRRELDPRSIKGRNWNGLGGFDSFAERHFEWDGLYRCEDHPAGSHASIEEAEACIQQPPAPTLGLAL